MKNERKILNIIVDHMKYIMENFSNYQFVQSIQSMTNMGGKIEKTALLHIFVSQTKVCLQFFCLNK